MKAGKPKHLPKAPPRDPTGFFGFLRAVMAARFGDHAKGRGRFAHETKAGSGRRRSCAAHPPGTKLVRRFIRDAEGEAHSYRADYLARTGRKIA